MKYDISELRSLVTDLVEDLDRQVDTNAEVREGLTAAWQEAVDKSRTADELEAWLEDYLTQVAVAWVLTSVFVRFLEDNVLVDGVWIAGDDRAGEDARDRTDEYFQKHPTDSETDYLLHVFRHFATLPAGALFGPKRNPLYNVRPSADAGRAILKFWREIDPDTGRLKREFASSVDGRPGHHSADEKSVDGRPGHQSAERRAQSAERRAQRDTRFLGDLYQELSEHAKKRFALLQTPDFVEDYILDYTLEPAIETFGLDTVRFIDPTCGSGHFLLGGFRRLFQKKLAARPGVPRIDLVREALDATHGVDLNPFAVAIARFRLLIAAMTAVSVDLKLDDVPDLPLHIAVGDTLIHGKRFPRFETSATKNVAQLELNQFKLTDQDRWVTEDNDLIDYVLGQQYHAVVGNPPYITPKDKAARDAYRDLYESCYRQYALVCPFYERFFELAGGERLGDDLFSGERWPHDQAGYVGQIVANSFMKREFGSKLIESVIPQTDLTHVIDTSGAYIPGHGTPTVILFGRNQAPSSPEVRAILGIRGEPKTPDDPRMGKVWRSISEHTDEVGFENDFVTVSDLEGELLSTHPWSLRGGGALEVKQVLDGEGVVLEQTSGDIGRTTVFGEDDAWLHDTASSRRAGLSKLSVPVVTGQDVRDYQIVPRTIAPYPYEEMGGAALGITEVPVAYFWRNRELLQRRTVFGKSLEQRGEPYFVHLEHYEYRLRTPLSITFAFVATHNHFVLDRGGKVFKQSAPVIKLPADATEDDHLGLLGLLNSSTACFWMKQVFFNKGYGADSKGARTRDEAFEDFYEFDGTKIKQFPLTETRPLQLATKLDRLAQRLGELQPASLADASTPTAAALDDARDNAESLERQMVALQEELDWRCYELYGLLDDGEAPLADDLDDVPQVKLGERAFEIVMARKLESGDLATSWFDRHGSTPITEIPDRWPAWYRDLVQRRIDLIAERRFVRLIEQPEYKRRWNRDSWEDREQDALRGWLLDRLETPAYLGDRDDPQPRLRRLAELADRAREDADFMQVAERYTHNPNVLVDKLIADLVAGESVPFLPAQRYKKGGIKKRRTWEKVWDLQRREDAGEKVKIPKPPKYTKGDFQSGTVYTLRGKLDVPKERFTSYPSLDHDGHTFVTWAGLDHKQRAQALATFFYQARDEFGFDPERLTLVLAGIHDLVPWVKQWHNELDPQFGIRFGDYLEGFVAQEASALGVGLEAVEKARL